MGFFGSLLEGFENVWDGVCYVHEEFNKACATADMNDAERARRNKMVHSELQYRITSCIRQLRERNADPDLINRLEIRLKNGVYEYEDLLKRYGYDPDSFDIKMERVKDIWDPYNKDHINFKDGMYYK